MTITTTIPIFNNYTYYRVDYNFFLYNDHLISIIHDLSKKITLTLLLLCSTLRHSTLCNSTLPYLVLHCSALLTLAQEKHSVWTLVKAIDRANGHAYIGQLDQSGPNLDVIDDVDFDYYRVAAVQEKYMSSDPIADLMQNQDPK